MLKARLSQTRILTSAVLAYPIALAFERIVKSNQKTSRNCCVRKDFLFLEIDISVRWGLSCSDNNFSNLLQLDATDSVQLKCLASATGLQLCTGPAHLYISRQIASRKSTRRKGGCIGSDVRQISRQS